MTDMSSSAGPLPGLMALRRTSAPSGKRSAGSGWRTNAGLGPCSQTCPNSWRCPNRRPRVIPIPFWAFGRPIAQNGSGRPIGPGSRRRIPTRAATRRSSCVSRKRDGPWASLRRRYQGEGCPKSSVSIAAPIARLRPTYWPTSKISTEAAPIEWPAPAYLVRRRTTFLSIWKSTLFSFTGWNDGKKEGPEDRDDGHR